MKIEHCALYAKNINALKAFYETYFGAEAGDFYYNPRTALKTCFLSFDGGARLELMTRPEVFSFADARPEMQPGYAHMAFGVGSEAQVDALTARLQNDGYEVVSAPRQTGDGYYESCVLDPEGNRIEITV